MNTKSPVRTAVVADLAYCATIINDYIDETDWLPRPFPRDEMLGHFERGFDTDRKMSVVEHEGEIVGYLSVEIRQPPQLPFVHALYLKFGYRGQGFGKALLDHAKTELKSGFELTFWEPNQAARAFYLREGLVEVPGGRDAETDDGVPTILMRWVGGLN
ncbi:MAG: GNAT family N-acetyltransferase [Pseudomonadota bacterium]